MAREKLFEVQDGYKMDKLCCQAVCVAFILGDKIIAKEFFEYFNDYEGSCGKFAKDLLESWDEKDFGHWEETKAQLSELNIMPMLKGKLREINLLDLGM